jgi:uncharacterized protein (DUF488 family)
VPGGRGSAVVTIGVYGWDLDGFLAALRRANVELLVDVRQRRGVRGPEYAWANSQRLQDSLTGAGVDYAHHPALAPTTELRHLQYEEDARQRVGKRSRVALAPRYVERYENEILAPADLEPLVASMPWGGAAALFCVERDPQACHRSLIAAKLADEYGATVAHLLPE